MIPVILSAAYVLPLPWRSRRLRDYPIVKIFVLAATWSFLTVVVPAISQGFSGSIELSLLFVERAAFIFAIAIPFDIRDMKADLQNDVITLPARLGVRNSKIAGDTAILISLACATMLFRNNVYAADYYFLLLPFYIVTAILIYRTKADYSDYYFTGLMDGLMLVMYLLAVIAY